MSDSGEMGPYYGGHQMVNLVRQQAERADDLAGKNDAQNIFNHLRQRMRGFQTGLENGMEMGVQLANFGLAQEIHIRQIGYKRPNLIEFFGVISDGSEVTLIQHISQLSFLLVALPPILEEKPYRIGF